MKLLSFFLCCLPALLHAQSDTIPQGIKFEQTLSWEQVKTKARTDNKYIFVDCYATWCGPCKMMEKEVYPNPEVGAALKDHFISVKVQMDSTTKDSEQTKKWYITAKKLLRDYKINGFPTYLFFSPNGELVHKEIGYMDVKNFVRSIQTARDPQKLIYSRQYHQYKQNKKEYQSMGKLALFTKDILGNPTFALEMAKDYKENYLDKMEPTDLYTKEHIDFIYTFPNLVHTKDKIFTICYRHSERFDSIIGFEGAAMYMVASVISREEIATKTLKNGKIARMPDWEQIEAYINEKYSSIDVRKMVLDYKVHYYREIYKDWKLWAKYKDELIKSYPPKAPYELQVYMDINGPGGAWHAFLHCNDTAVLAKAIEWADVAIALDGRENKYKLAAYLDTKANLLYKLGKNEEAIKLQKEALELVPKDTAILETYAKMQRGEPTWPPQ